MHSPQLLTQVSELRADVASAAPKEKGCTCSRDQRKQGKAGRTALVTSEGLA